jgi:hypothetical protein
MWSITFRAPHEPKTAPHIATHAKKEEQLSTHTKAHTAEVGTEAS